MNMIFERKLAIPMEVKEMYPLTGTMSQVVEQRIAELKGFRDMLAAGDREGMREKMRLSTQRRALFDRK